MTTFARFLPMGGKYIAVFNEPDQEVRLTQDDLAERIGNLIGQGLDASVEMEALAGLKQINDLIGSAPALRESHDQLLEACKASSGVALNIVLNLKNLERLAPYQLRRRAEIITTLLNNLSESVERAIAQAAVVMR